MAVVVLSVGAPADLRGAVVSLIRQRPQPAEIVVVNSGGGDPLEVLGTLLPERLVVTGGDRMSHGATRNVGVAATSAPVVAFLSADCRAMPGWVAARQALHDQGHLAVASAVVSRYPRNVIASAAHVALFSRRMPNTPAPERLLYGLSYDRSIFHRIGGFREDLDGNEDADFNGRLRDAGIEPQFASDVLTAHPHPRRLEELIRDQFRRGRRMATFHSNEGTLEPSDVALNAVKRMPADLTRALRGTPPGERLRLAPAVPLVLVAALAYATGAARVAGKATSPAVEEGVP